MKQIMRIDHVGLRVRNLDIAREFYEQLKFEFIVSPIGPEPVAVMEHPTAININFILNTSNVSLSLHKILVDTFPLSGSTPSRDRCSARQKVIVIPSEHCIAVC